MLTRRTYAVSPNRDVIEVFMDGSISYIPNPREGFFIAFLIGPRGESHGTYKVLPWAGGWQYELAQQKATHLYLQTRPAIQLPPLPYRPLRLLPNWEQVYEAETPPVRSASRQPAKHREPEHTWSGAGRNGNNRSDFEAQFPLTPSDDSEPDLADDSSELEVEADGSLEDLISALQSTGTEGSTEELRSLALAIRAGR